MDAYWQFDKKHSQYDAPRKVDCYHCGDVGSRFGICVACGRARVYNHTRRLWTVLTEEQYNQYRFACNMVAFYRRKRDARKRAA